MELSKAKAVAGLGAVGVELVRVGEVEIAGVAAADLQMMVALVLVGSMKLLFCPCQ